ncbi:MAG: type IV pilus assembly protein PilM [Planctomycetes bacterium]|nr:type IV pilus assembly protein PilM [Planctomycetota bacterium]
MFNFTKTEILGLDIGSSAVKLVRLCKDDAGYAVAAAGIAEIAVGEEENIHLNTVKAIRECFESVPGMTKMAVCGLSGPEVAVRDFEFPSLTTSELDGAVLFEASQACPFNAAESAVDYHLIPDADTDASDGRGDDKTRGILVAATNGLITGKKRLTEEAALKCVLMDIEGLALLNCFNGLASGSEKSTTAILNVGSSGTTVAIMGGNGWPFIRDMTFAGDDIIKQIAADKGMSTENVKRILSGDSTTAQTDLHDSLERNCQKLIDDVSNTLRYYAAQEQSTRVEKIFVCGGFALAKGFIELLNSQPGVEAVLWNPFDKIRCDTARKFEDICKTRGPSLAVAAGLAMRSV